MRLGPAAALALLLLVWLAACEDDPTRPPVEATLEGDWEVVEVDLRATAKKAVEGLGNTVQYGHSYMSIDATRLHAINERGPGFRGEFVAAYSAGDSLELDEESFAVEYGRGFVRLENPRGHIRLERRDAIPSAEAWIADYSSVFAQNTTFQSTGDIAWDGSDLWISGVPAGKEMIRIDSGTLTAFPLAVSGLAPNAIEFSAGECYAAESSESSLHAVDVESGDASDAGVQLARFTTCLMARDDYLWFGSRRSRQLHLVSLTSGQQTFSIPIGEGVTLAGGAAHGRRLLLAANGVLTTFETQLDDGQVELFEPAGTIRLPGHDIIGVAMAGAALWVNTIERSTGAVRLHRIQEESGAG